MSYDAIVIGSGAGGATIARALGGAGRKVLVLERGDYLPREPSNWDAEQVFRRGRYHTDETWLDGYGRSFTPQENYHVGGKTKVYGAALIRMRPDDFGEVRHYGGLSPAWALTYDEMEPYYAKAEEWYHVGHCGHVPAIARLAARMERAGLHPEPAPSALLEHCTRCDTCDGFPCMVKAKADAETCGIAPALETGNVDLITGMRVTRILRRGFGGIRGVECQDTANDIECAFEAPVVILAAGAVNSAALWLQSGLPDSSGQAGRNYMCHQSQAVLAIGTERLPRGFHKTVMDLSFYRNGPDGLPLGSIQMAGQPSAAMLRGESGLARIAPGMREIADRAVVFWLMTEDLPSWHNRVTVEDGRIRLSYYSGDVRAQYELYRQLAKRLPSLGYPLHLRKYMPLSAVAHQCGTLRMSRSPSGGVVKPSGESWEVPGLYVADASVFPSSSAVNPALTVMANAIRVAGTITERQEQ